jgi:hypothetical protein
VAEEEYSLHCRPRPDKAKLFLTHRIYYSRSGAADLKTAVLLSYRLMINYSGMQPTAERITAAELRTSVHDTPNFHTVLTQVPRHRTSGYSEKYNGWTIGRYESTENNLNCFLTMALSPLSFLFHQGTVPGGRVVLAGQFR